MAGFFQPSVGAETTLFLGGGAHPPLNILGIQIWINVYVDICKGLEKILKIKDLKL